MLDVGSSACYALGRSEIYMPGENRQENSNARPTDPLRQAVQVLMWRVPMLLPLAVVGGVIWGSSLGWVLALASLLTAHLLRMWRICMCCLLSGLIVCTTQALRHEQEQGLREALAEHGVVSLQGTVVEELGRGCIVETGWAGVRVVVRGEMPWRVADVVRLTAQEAPVQPPPVEGMFSAVEWMRTQGLCANLTYLQGERVGRSMGWSRLCAWAGRLRAHMADVLMPPGAGSDARHQVLCALVLGEKSRAEADTMEVFRRGGCMHAFAVSGLHVGLVSGIIYLLLRLLRVPPAVGRYVVLGLTGVYVVATGMAVPALRAYLMLAAIVCGLILRRRAMLFNIWCFAALLILLVEPQQLYMAGFQLSFVVYAAICLTVQYAMHDRPWFGPDAYIPTRIRTRLERFGVVAELFVRGTVLVSLSAWLVSLPICIAQFHTINTSSYLTNILIAPLLPVVMSCGLLALLLAPIPWLGAVCHQLAVLTSGWLISLVSAMGAHPAAYLPACEPAAPEAYMIAALGHGKSFCVLGNPGLLLGDVQQEGDARYTVAPALFHAGFSPAAVVCGEGARAPERLGPYRAHFPRMRPVQRAGAGRVRRFTTRAGEYTLYYPPEQSMARLGVSEQQPVVVWRSCSGERVMYIGRAAMSTLETLPPEELRADLLICGYNTREPVLDTEYLRRMQPQRLILLPDITTHPTRADYGSVAPAPPESLDPDKRRIIRHP